MLHAICIFEDKSFSQLYPLSLTRPVFELRCGMSRLKDKMRRRFPKSTLYLSCRDYLAETVRQENPGVKVNELDSESCLFLNGRTLLDKNLTEIVQNSEERIYTAGKNVVAIFLKKDTFAKVLSRDGVDFDIGSVDVPCTEVEAKTIEYPWDLVNQNASQILADFDFLGAGGKNLGDISKHAVLLNKPRIYIGSGSKVKPGAVLDAEHGPIYLGENVTVMPNAVIAGPAFVGDNSLIKIGAKIYEETSIGEWCKVGGEVEESIIHSFSNKQHEGFLGHSYLGQWVNIGADTNNSDLKNNYSHVKVQIDGEMVDSGSQFVGLFMGDHSKTGINTMFNTGTVVGVMSNVFGAGFPPKFIPSFAWGGSEGFVEHDPDKALATARRVMARRKIALSKEYENMLRDVFKLTAHERVHPGGS
ncbi:MAG: GlmU family protein [bacterium]